MGHGYVLGCPEDGEARLNLAVAKVDEAMCKIRDAGKINARDRIAVLAALNLAFDLTDRPQAQDPNSPSLSMAQMQSLLQRMDAVLGHDNQLL